MKAHKSKNHKRNLIVKVILGFIVGISLGFGVTKLVKSDNLFAYPLSFQSL